MKQIILGLAIAGMTSLPVLAAHNNPWATPEDTVLAKYHDANQEQSIGTPGEDEMHGHMAQDDARGSDQGHQSRGGGGRGQ